MYQLIYTSLACTPFNGKTLRRLLTRSQIRNAESGVTGALIFCSGRFLQALEGEMGAVMATFGRIEADPRHREIEVLQHDANLGRRKFGQWSMGYSDPGQTTEALKGYRGRNVEFSIEALRKINLVEFLLHCQRTCRPSSVSAAC